MPNTYPTTLNTLFTKDDNQHDNTRNSHGPIRLTSEEAHSILELPLTKAICGHSNQDSKHENEAQSGNTLLTHLTSGSGEAQTPYTSFIAERAKKLVDERDQDQTSEVEQRRSQLLHIGLAALFSFLQSNVTGPPLEFNPAELLFPNSAPRDVREFRGRIIRELSVDGEAAYQLTPNVELFAVAKGVLVDGGGDVFGIGCGEDGGGDGGDRSGYGYGYGRFVARLARMRVNFLHQKMLSEVTGTLQDAIFGDLEVLGRVLLSSDDGDGDGSLSARKAFDKGSFLLERSLIHTHHGFDARARADIEQAAAVRGFEFALTGKLGKRTKFQDRDISQLVVLAKSADKKEDETKSEQQQQQQQPHPSGPKNLDLNDDTLLESISFTKNVDDKSQQEGGGKAGTIQDETSLPPTLAALEPGNQPILDPIDSAILLALATAITNTSPDYGLTREETLPYATRVLEGGSSNWQIYTQALLVRSRIEGYKARTVERSVLQMQALVDQVIADTASFDMATGQSAEAPTTFLPRPEQTESAPAAERLEYIWFMNFSTRWDLEAELASRWVNLGGLRTALEIYERLQLWAEVALCYAATDREAKAKSVVRGQLYEPTNRKADDEVNDDDEKFEGPERSPLPANAPRLFCILGDIDTDPAMYERAWEVSNRRYARAQRSLARYYLTQKPPALEKAEDAYKKSLYINRLNHSAWFALGCVQLELEKWKDSVESFTRTVQIEETDAEAWSNLAAAILRVPPSKQAVDLSSADENNDNNNNNNGEVTVDVNKPKRDALSALHRAAQLKHTDHRIWDNVLTVAASIPPPLTPFRDIVQAQRRLIELLGPKKGENAVDIPVTGLLVDYLVSNYEYEDLVISTDADTNNTNQPSSTTQPQQPPQKEQKLRIGTTPAQILLLIDTNIVPLITHSSALWLLVSRIEQFRHKPTKALEAHEKAWRATVASSTQGAFQMGDEKRWNEVVRATERLVVDGYAKFGPMEREKEREDGGSEGEGEGEGEDGMVAKDWRFKGRSAVRGVLGKGREFWEDTEGWKRLRGLQVELSGM